MMLRGNIIIGYQATQIAFNKCAPFTKYITKVDGTTIDDAEILDLVLPMYSLIENSSNIKNSSNIVKNILKQQKFYDYIQKMKQLILMQVLPIIIILNLSIIRLNY